MYCEFFALHYISFDKSFIKLYNFNIIPSLTVEKVKSARKPLFKV